MRSSFAVQAAGTGKIVRTSVEHTCQLIKLVMYSAYTAEPRNIRRVSLRRLSGVSASRSQRAAAFNSQRTFERL